MSTQRIREDRFNVIIGGVPDEGDCCSELGTHKGGGGRFDKSKAEEFARRSTSEAPRRANERVVREFFASVGNLHPQAIEYTHVRAWRDSLTRRRQKASTVSFKLAVVRSFFSYLIALGMIEKNPADTKFILPPALPEDMAGRALTSEEARKVLAGPDRRKPEGARDYALLQVMFRVGMRVSEVCSLPAIGQLPDTRIRQAALAPDG